MERSGRPASRAGATQFELRAVLLAALTPETDAALADLFDRELLPALTPIALDGKHPMPDLPAGSVGVVVRFRRPGRRRVGVVVVPSLLPRSLSIRGPSQEMTFRVEDVIARYVSRLFTTLPVEKCWSFSVTRSDEPEQLRFVIARAA
jgi:polyphosphate kinase